MRRVAPRNGIRRRFPDTNRSLRFHHDCPVPAQLALRCWCRFAGQRIHRRRHGSRIRHHRLPDHPANRDRWALRGVQPHADRHGRARVRCAGELRRVRAHAGFAAVVSRCQRGCLRQLRTDLGQQRRSGSVHLRRRRHGGRAERHGQSGRVFRGADQSATEHRACGDRAFFGHRGERHADHDLGYRRR